VISNTGVKLTYNKLIGNEHLPPEVVGQVARHRTDSIAFKINLATKALPRWVAYDARRLNEPNPGSVTHRREHGRAGRSLRHGPGGEISRRPYLWITTPSAFDPTVAPEGSMSCRSWAAMCPIAEGARLDRGDAAGDLLDIVLSQICRYAPGFDKDVMHAQILTPPDIEEMFAMTGGHVHHGEMSLDQVFFRRPIAHYADYRTPVKQHVYVRRGLPSGRWRDGGAGPQCGARDPARHGPQVPAERLR
jgi:phytoene dehydrogenase-like protein